MGAKQNKELEKSYAMRGLSRGVCGVTGKSALAVEIAILFPVLTLTSLLNAFELVNPTAMEGPETGQCLRGHVITMQ